jgi:DtxR family transcriptional regulator, Mn-dependent transcriptional regulator
MRMQESAEMYLETVLVLRERNGVVRSIDIANDLGFSRASVSVAIRELAADGYIEIDALKQITLTESGEAIAQKIYNRHKLLSTLLMRVGVSEETALEDACRIEHYISDESIEALQHYYQDIVCG